MDSRFYTRPQQRYYDDEEAWDEGLAPSKEESLERVCMNVETLYTLWAKRGELDRNSRSYVVSFMEQWSRNYSLSPKQWRLVEDFLGRIDDTKGIPGNFLPTLIMFRLAGGKLKNPKIRLVTEENEFIQLDFNPELTRQVKVYQGGWAGHGQRRFIGWIKEKDSQTFLTPYRKGDFTPDIVDCLQNFAKDPLQAAKAAAMKLSACCFCGQRLSDEPSKEVGYGPVCAESYLLPWGTITQADRTRQQEVRQMTKDDLANLFKK